MSLVELGTTLAAKQLQLLHVGLERLWYRDDLWMFICGVPFFAAMLSWPIGYYWVVSRNAELARRWFLDQLILVGAGLVFGGVFLVARTLG